jgi:hypothetical protein
MSTNDAKSSDSADGACGTGTCGGGWRLPVLLALVLAAILIARRRGEGYTTVAPQNAAAPDAASDAAQPGNQTVSLAIAIGDGVERRFDAVPWHEGMTVDDLLTAASRRPNGIQYSVRGDGASALLMQIDEARNEGPRGRNWTYTVNGTRADRSFAVYPLRPGDQVLWTFAAAE